MEHIEYLIVGAGVIGLAVARELVSHGKEVVLIDSADSFGNGTSSRNSEVIHAGIYYPPGSEKAKHCIRGAELMFRYCQDNNIQYSRCGKLIVASTQSEIANLESIKDNAAQCGVSELEIISKSTVADLEPELNCEAALYSPNTGIVDSHGFMQSLETEIDNLGGLVSYKTDFIDATNAGDGYICNLMHDASEAFQLKAEKVINCGGLQAVQISRSVDDIVKAEIPRAAYSKGNYYSYGAKNPFRHLIYPLPNELGLGIHATIDLDNKLKFGPNTEEVVYDNYDKISMQVNKKAKPYFVDAIGRYWSNDKLQNLLNEDYAGIRPKIATVDGTIIKDFLITQHNDRFLGLYGIESPGLTSSLSIAKSIAECKF